MRTYESVAVLGGGLHKDGPTFRPATYEHSDDFGMLGGHMRVAAAVGMYLMGQSRFLFSGGTSAKLVSAFGNAAPVEAVIYRDAFLYELMICGHDPDHEALCAERGLPETLLDPVPPNTVSNLQTIRDVSNARAWGSVAVLTNAYHMPRAEAWWEVLSGQAGDAPLPAIEFLAAEDIVAEVFPGVYDSAIHAAYQSPAGKLRLQNEASGLQDLREGRRVYGEFQLVSGAPSN